MTSTNIDPDTDPNQHYISGARNIIRLEGTIDGVKKIVRLLICDPNYIYRQGQCRNIFSENIDDYLVKTFGETNKEKKKYDIFADVDAMPLTNPPADLNRTTDYAGKIRQLFTNLFKFDVEKNKVLRNGMFKNIRFHYTPNIFDFNFPDTITIANKVRNVYQDYNFIKNNLRQIIDELNLIKDRLTSIKNIVESSDDSKFKVTDSSLDTNIDMTEKMKHLNYKIQTKYVHTKVKKVMKTLVKDIINTINLTLDNISQAVAKFILHCAFYDKVAGKLTYYPDVEKYSYDISYMYDNDAKLNIYKKVISITSDCNKLLAGFENIYLLRRILDKDYITNSIIIHNGPKCSYFIRVMIKYFNFKITHSANSSIQNMPELNSRVHDGTLNDAIVLMYPKKNIECSNVANFPKNFS